MLRSRCDVGASGGVSSEQREPRLEEDGHLCGSPKYKAKLDLLAKQSGSGHDKSLLALDKYTEIKTAWISLNEETN